MNECLNQIWDLVKVLIPDPKTQRMGSIVVLIKASPTGELGEAIYESNISKSTLPTVLRDIADEIERRNL